MQYNVERHRVVPFNNAISKQAEHKGVKCRSLVHTFTLQFRLNGTSHSSPSLIELLALTA